MSTDADGDDVDDDGDDDDDDDDDDYDDNDDDARRRALSRKATISGICHAKLRVA